MDLPNILTDCLPETEVEKPGKMLNLHKKRFRKILCHYVEERAVEQVGLINHDGLNQLNPQVTWLVDRRGRTMVDKIYRYEELSSSWPDIWHDIGFGDEPPDLPKLNDSQGRGEPHDYFSESTISIAQKAFRNDFETLGYSMAPYWLASVGHERSAMQ